MSDRKNLNNEIDYRLEQLNAAIDNKRIADISRESQEFRDKLKEDTKEAEIAAKHRKEEKKHNEEMRAIGAGTNPIYQKKYWDKFANAHGYSSATIAGVETYKLEEMIVKKQVAKFDKFLKEGFEQHGMIFFDEEGSHIKGNLILSKFEGSLMGITLGSKEKWAIEKCFLYIDYAMSKKIVIWAKRLASKYYGEKDRKEIVGLVKNLSKELKKQNS
ncbi:MAG: hypothetical protein FWE02_05945 [Defluviitaleaceae bacterium]|nr:hypothetical protein [Defluviitaleaceae bacterium]